VHATILHLKLTPSMRTTVFEIGWPLTDTVIERLGLFVPPCWK